MWGRVPVGCGSFEHDAHDPLIRQQLSEKQQFDIAQRLLIDLQAQDSGWLLTWLTPACDRHGTPAAR